MPESNLEVPQDGDGEEIEKTVTMVGYDADLDFPSLEDWAAEITGMPVNEHERVTTDRTKVKMQFGREELTKILASHSFDDDELERAKKRLEDAGIDNFTIETERESHMESKASLGRAGKDLKERLFDEGPESLSGGLERHPNGWSRWVDESQQWSVKLRASEFDERRVLAKETERESDDKYETMSKVPAFSFNVKMKAPTQELIDTWTEEVIPVLHKALSNIEDVGKVRYMACTVTQQRSGECYNI